MSMKPPIPLMLLTCGFAVFGIASLMRGETVVGGLMLALTAFNIALIGFDLARTRSDKASSPVEGQQK